MGPTQPVLKPKKGYWYKHFIEECPVCGRSRQWKKRQYTSVPPKDDPSRWDYDGMAYDWCDY